MNAFPKNQKEARLMANQIVAKLISQYLDAGQPWNDGMDAGFEIDDPAVVRLAEALKVLRHRCERNSGDE